ncbi:hypothetical protein EUTSA_v10011041mg, partial [Eutrema salsugineum]
PNTERKQTQILRVSFELQGSRFSKELIFFFCFLPSIRESFLEFGAFPIWIFADSWEISKHHKPLFYAFP